MELVIGKWLSDKAMDNDVHTCRLAHFMLTILLLYQCVLSCDLLKM